MLASASPSSAPPKTLERAFSMLGRVLRRRCPNCGRATAFAGFFQLAPTCTACGLMLHHGPHDHFVGTTMVNFLLAEVTWAFGFMFYLVAVWPNVPWDAVTGVSAAFMVILPVTMYPITRLTWLAVDLFLRPGGEGERRVEEAARHR